MPCEKYQNALIDLAAGVGSAGILPASLNLPNPAPNEIRAHLDTCAPCRSDLDRQQLLFASIDSDIRRTANAPLPPALLHRFQARLAQQGPPRPAASPSWIYAGAAFVAAALLLLVLPRLGTHDANRQAAAPLATRQTTSRAPEVVAHLTPPTPSPRSMRRASKPNALPPKPSEPEVLVPPDERIAFEHFLADLNGREDLAIALVNPMQAQPQPHTAPVAAPVPVEMPDIETVALNVPSLSGVADR
jgi:hypothetical protein